ncbi:MAG: nickel-dependent lactate racemase [Gaiella sp.]
MRVSLAFGETGLEVDLPDGRTTVITPRHPPPAPDGRAAVVAALRSPIGSRPLRELVRPGQTVAISICDGTRPQPRRVVVPALLEEIGDVVGLENVVVLVATGTHRANTDEELRAMLGDEVRSSVEVVNHDARDAGAVRHVGVLGKGVPVWLNTRWLDADVRITTGFVEPHFFAGFSGGPKLVAPGLAGLETVLTLHDATRIGHPDARWGVIEGNPVHDDVRAIARATGTHFALDVVLDAEKRIVQAFGGELFAMHEAACAVARRVAMRPVAEPFDVVVTTNSGFPLDQNLYQAVKGISAAAQVVRPGGAIVCAAECRDGFPAHGSFRAELEARPDPEEAFAAVMARERTVPDQWQIQILAGIRRRSRLLLYTAALADADLQRAGLDQVPDVGQAVAELLHAAGAAARVCVLPEGPQTIPYVA